MPYLAVDEMRFFTVLLHLAKPLSTCCRKYEHVHVIVFSCSAESFYYWSNCVLSPVL